jgi:GATA-binding protein
MGDMDWRNQSRSRSRVPQAITGGMDWRNASRSRSRAPNMRFSLPSGPAGVHLPTYADIVETMASVGRADVSTAAAPAAHVPSQTAQGGNQQINNQTSEAELQSFEQTLKQLIAEGEAAAGNTQASNNPDKSQTAGKRASRNLESTVLPYSYIPPAPLPISPSNWMNSPPATQEGSGIPQASSVPKHAQSQPQQAAEQLSYTVANSAGQAQQYAGSPIAAVESGLLQSQNSITASVEAYLSSLGHPTSVIDLPPHRHVGSVPGLFNEQDLKANQHADYGFLPKLVRKTSFDASYPAQLAHEQQKQAQKKQRTPQQFAQPLPQMTDHQAQSQSHEVSSLYTLTCP